MIIDIIPRGLGKQCPNCKAYHENDSVLEEICKNFDPNHPCRLCGLSVFALSMGGPEICSSCDCGLPREVYVEYVKNLAVGSDK